MGAGQMEKVKVGMRVATWGVSKTARALLSAFSRGKLRTLLMDC